MTNTPYGGIVVLTSCASSSSGGVGRRVGLRGSFDRVRNTSSSLLNRGMVGGGGCVGTALFASFVTLRPRLDTVLAVARTRSVGLTDDDSVLGVVAAEASEDSAMKSRVELAHPHSIPLYTRPTADWCTSSTRGTTDGSSRRARSHPMSVSHHQPWSNPRPARPPCTAHAPRPAPRPRTVD